MDFETDKEIEDEMNEMLDNMVVPMMEGTGRVELMGVLFPDNEHLPDDIKKDVNKGGAKACMLFPSAAVGSKEEWYEGISELTKRMKVRNAFMISDTWIVEGAEDLSVAPSEHPDRTDAFVIHYVNTDINGILMKAAMLVCKYELKSDKVVEKERIFTIQSPEDNLHSEFVEAVSNNTWV